MEEAVEEAGAAVAVGGGGGVDGVASRVLFCLLSCDGIRGCTADADDRVTGTALKVKRPSPVAAVLELRGRPLSVSFCSG